jgi:hypothetical protein
LQNSLGNSRTRKNRSGLPRGVLQPLVCGVGEKPLPIEWGLYQSWCAPGLPHRISQILPKPIKPNGSRIALVFLAWRGSVR